jgi:archaellum biogenesis ATPase FlaH
MNKKANYTILPELKLIIECCKGDATDEESAQMKMAEVLDKNYDPTFNIIVDFREFETFINNTTFESISAFVHFLKALKIQSKVAFLTTKPHQVVVGEYLKELMNQRLDIELGIFSTVDACAEYLGYTENDLPQIRAAIAKTNEITG